MDLTTQLENTLPVGQNKIKLDKQTGYQKRQYRCHHIILSIWVNATHIHQPRCWTGDRMLWETYSHRLVVGEWSPPAPLQAQITPHWSKQGRRVFSSNQVAALVSHGYIQQIWSISASNHLYHARKTLNNGKKYYK